MIDQGKCRKREIIRKCTEQEYHVQDDDDETHKNVKMFCDTTQFPSFLCCVPHKNLHGVRGLRNNYHMKLIDDNGGWSCDF